MKGQKGITLVALVITIIVMLILVGVTINIAINGGLIEKTREAAYKTDAQSIQEAFTQGKVFAIAEHIAISSVDMEYLKDNGYISADLYNKYGDKLIASGGKLYYDTSSVTDATEQKWLQDIGIMPYTGNQNENNFETYVANYSSDIYYDDEDEEYTLDTEALDSNLPDNIIGNNQLYLDLTTEDLYVLEAEDSNTIAVNKMNSNSYTHYKGYYSLVGATGLKQYTLWFIINESDGLAFTLAYDGQEKNCLNGIYAWDSVNKTITSLYPPGEAKNIYMSQNEDYIIYQDGNGAVNNVIATKSGNQLGGIASGTVYTYTAPGDSEPTLTLPFTTISVNGKTCNALGYDGTGTLGYRYTYSIIGNDIYDGPIQSHSGQLKLGDWTSGSLQSGTENNYITEIRTGSNNSITYYLFVKQ